MSNEGRTVGEILAEKKDSIENAPLPPGFPGWDQVMDVSWEDVTAPARANEPGFRELRKLLSDKRFNR